MKKKITFLSCILSKKFKIFYFLGWVFCFKKCNGNVNVVKDQISILVLMEKPRLCNIAIKDSVYHMKDHGVWFALHVFHLLVPKHISRFRNR